MGFWGKLKEKAKLVWDNMTIEPAVFFIFFSQGLDGISEDQLLIVKTCLNDFDYGPEVCDDLLSENNTDINSEVQNEVSDFKVWQTLAKNIFPLFFAFYIGSWCDLFGRKVVMYTYLIFQLIAQGLLVLNSAFMNWPKEILLTGPLLTGLVGGYSVFNLANAAFISDVSKPEHRAFRLGLIHIASSIPRPFVGPIGAWLLREGGFVCVTSASFVGIFLSLILLYFNLRRFDWQPPKKEFQLNVFSCRHPQASVKALVKKRPGSRRLYLFLVMITIAMIISPFSGEGQVQYLFVRTKFGWGVDEFSNYRSFDSTIGILGEIFCIPFFACLKMNESVVFLIVTLSPFLRHLVQGVSVYAWMYYLGAIFDLIGRYSTSVGKAMISACVPLTEFGKILAFITVLDSIIPMIIAPVYSALWKSTESTYPGTVFLLSAGLTMVSVICAATILIHSKCERFCQEPTEAENEEGEKHTGEEMEPKPLEAWTFETYWLTPL